MITILLALTKSFYNGATILPTLAKSQETIFSMFCCRQQNMKSGCRFSFFKLRNHIIIEPPFCQGWQNGISCIFAGFVCSANAGKTHFYEIKRLRARRTPEYVPELLLHFGKVRILIWSNHFVEVNKMVMSTQFVYVSIYWVSLQFQTYDIIVHFIA